jgi:hypothetical protein
VRVTTIHCSRCSRIVTSDLSILKIEAGSLINDLAEPYIDISGPYVDLCPGCTSLFRDWLRSRRRNGQHEAVANVAGISERNAHRGRQPGGRTSTDQNGGHT